ncbi:MAG: GspE/PulE family protein [Candidatus Methylacidiphilaceae bacterium]
MVDASWRLIDALVRGGAISGTRPLDPSRPAEESLLEAGIPPEIWTEVFGALPGLPPFFPAGACVPGREETPPDLLAEWSLVLAREPAVLIGCLNPFRRHAADAAAAVLFPNSARFYCLLTPDGWQKAGSAEAGPPLSTDALLEAAGWQPDLYREPADVLESLARTGSSILAVPSRWIAPIRSLRCGGIVAWETETQAWVATDRFTSGGFWREATEDLLGKRLTLLAQGRSGMKDLSGRIPGGDGGAKVAAESICIRQWPATEDPDTLFRSVIGAAIRSGASDVLATPVSAGGRSRIRFAIGGEWREQACLVGRQHRALLKRAKTIGAGMKPDTVGELQDGDGEEKVDGVTRRLRLSVVPLDSGEDQLAVRIHEEKPRRLADLHLPDGPTAAIRWYLSQRHGLFLAIGPTGSGKTTLLYAMALEIAGPSVHLMTIEDPPERRFAEASQTRANPIPYPALIKGGMRQFPQAILVGEIRDAETAMAAIQAALTGHKVLSSIHAANPAEAFNRLEGFGLDRPTIASSVKLCVAQGLAPRLCRKCKAVRPATAGEVAVFPDVELDRYLVAERRGCRWCRWTGIENGMDRIPLFEVTPVDSHVRTLLYEKASPEKIRRHNRERGYPTIEEEAARLAFSGEIEVREAARFLDLPPAAGQQWIG